MFSKLKIINFVNCPALEGLLILHFSLFSLLSAGAPDTLWTRTYGGDSSDCARSLQQTSDGGFIIAGDTKSFGAGRSDVYLIKTNSNGDTLWTRTYGGTNYDYGRSVQQTNDGGFVIAGYTNSFGAGFDDVYLIRTNSNGDELWAKTYGKANWDRGLSVQQTNDSGFIITGLTNSFGAGDQDVYLIRTDFNGDTLWTRTYGGTHKNIGKSIQLTTDNGFIIAGYKDTLDSLGITYHDVYLIRTNFNGDTLWAKTYGGTDYEVSNSVQQTNDGGFVIAGYTNSFGAGNSDVYLIRTNENGDTLWTRTYGGNDSDIGNSVQQLNDGGFIIAGHTASFGIGPIDVYLIRTNENGDTLWTSTYGGDNYDDSHSVQQTSDGGFIITGHRGGDVYLIRLENETLGIQEDIPTTFINPYDFNVFYNKKNISIHYRILYPIHVKLEAYDIKGKLVKVITDKFMQKGSYSVKWDSKRFGAGVYFLRLSVNGSEVSRKVTIVR